MKPDAPDFDLTFARLRRDPQALAREAAGAGARVVGYVGDTVPVELLLAAEAWPVRMHGAPGGDRRAADEVVESSFPAVHRGIAGQWLAGALDHLDAVVFARSDDAGQRLYYYLCELQRRGLCRGPRPLLFDGALLTRPSSVEHTLASAGRLAEELGTRLGSLPAARRRLADREQWLRGLRAQRQSRDPLAGSAAWALEYLAGCDGADDFTARASRWLEQAPRLRAPRRVLLAGDALPDDQLHRALEARGATLVAELTGASLVGPPSPRDGLDALADECQRRESPALSMRRDPRWVADAARALGADAAVLWLSEQDEALPWEVARQMQSLREAGVPALLLARQPEQITPAAVQQVVAFLVDSGKTS